MRRFPEPEPRGNLLQVQIMHVEHFLEPVSGVGVEVGLEGALGLPVQIIVLLDKRLELVLDLH